MYQPYYGYILLGGNVQSIIIIVVVGKLSYTKHTVGENKFPMSTPFPRITLFKTCVFLRTTSTHSYSFVGRVSSPIPSYNLTVVWQLNGELFVYLNYVSECCDSSLPLSIPIRKGVRGSLDYQSRSDMERTEELNKGEKVTPLHQVSTYELLTVLVFLPRLGVHV